MQCPNCGADQGWQARFSQLLVCSHCNTASYVDQGALRAVGQMASLAQTPGPFYLHGTGLWSGMRFTVIGRVRYSYEQGFWDEWLLNFQDGSTRWVGEDGDEYTITTLKDRPFPTNLYDKAQPGGRLLVGTHSYHVDEKGIAECVGGEGQLPFVVTQGERTPYLDLSFGERHVATLEVSAQGHARVYAGERADLSQVQMDVPVDDAEKMAAGAALDDGAAAAQFGAVTGAAAERLACLNCGAPLPEQSGAALLKCEYCSTDNDSSLPHSQCPNCSAHFVVPGGHASPFRVCPSCDHQFDVSTGQPTAVPGERPTTKPDVRFRIGQSCTFRGKEYVLTGHIRSFSDGAYADEFFLFNPLVGYRTLEEEDGHYTFSELVTDPGVTVPALPGATFRYQGRKYKVVEVGQSRVTWVSGQLPWVEQVGNTSEYVDAVSPPRLISATSTDREVEYFVGELVDRAEVAKAFGLRESDLPPPIGRSPAQPYIQSPTRRVAIWTAAIVAALQLVLFLWALTAGKQVATLDIPGESAQREYFTDTFTIHGHDQLVDAEFYAGIDNSWIYLDAAVVDDQGNAVQEFSAEWEYYHGYSGGESWSEGSQHHTETFKLAEPGDYRLLVKQDAPRNYRATVKIEENVVLARYFLVIFLLAAGYLGLEIYLWYNYKKALLED